MGYTTQLDDGSQEQVERERIPADLIATATITSIELNDFTWKDKVEKNEDGSPVIKTGRKLKWLFKITEGEFEGRWVRGETRANLSTRSDNDYRNWAETALNRELTPSEKLDTDDLIGLRVKVHTIHTVDKNDAKKIYVKVDELLPVSGGFSFDDEPPF
jgi:predicted RNA-binding protein (virulence factor B family)